MHGDFFYTILTGDQGRVLIKFGSKWRWVIPNGEKGLIWIIDHKLQVLDRINIVEVETVWYEIVLLGSMNHLLAHYLQPFRLALYQSQQGLVSIDDAGGLISTEILPFDQRIVDLLDSLSSTCSRCNLNVVVSSTAIGEFV